MICKTCYGQGGDPFGGSMCEECNGAGLIQEYASLTHCPICKQKIDSYAECETAKPYTAFTPMEGLLIWGAYDMPKETVCYEDGGEWIHFRTEGAEGKPFEQLVLMTRARKQKEAA